LFNVSLLVQYDVIQDDASGQMPQHFFEGTMNEDASDKVQHNTNQSVPDPITFDTSVIYVSCIIYISSGLSNLI